MLRVGSFLGNRYEIIARIGTGGMSYVYKAKDHKLSRFDAIKVLKQEFASDPNFVSKFRMEAQSAACLSHPNIVNIFDVCEEGGMYYIVMEYIDGITLKKYIENKKKLEIREAIEVSMQVARGLEAAHKAHIIHRDIKPQNIMISRDGKVKVADFGIARAASAQTISSNLMGSVHYISPEQAKGGYCDERSDIYSLGITMYEMLTGRVPFEGGSTVAVALLHIQGEMVPPRKIDPMIPVSLEKIILKCTQKKPEYRYSSVTEVINDLRQSLSLPNGDYVRITPFPSDAPTQMFAADEVNRALGEESVAGSDDRTAESAYQMGMEDGDDFDDYEDEYDDRPGGKSKSDKRFERIITIIMVAVVALIVVIGLVVGLRACGVLSFGNAQTTEESDAQSVMVDLCGMTADEAKAALEPYGVTITITEYGYSESYEKGQIYWQGLEAGQPLAGVTSVEVKISTGSNKAVIPSDIVGKSEQDVRRELNSVGFTNVLSAVTEEYSDDYAAGTVIGSDPAPGSSADKSEAITLIVSKGVKVTTTTVPDIVGMTVAAAREALSDVGLSVGDISYEESYTTDAGRIISVSPDEGSAIRQGGSVDIVVSSGEPASTTTEAAATTTTERQTTQQASYYVPALVGMGENSAMNLILNSGLSVGDVTYETVSDSSLVGVVISQSPSSGSAAEEGDLVDIVVGAAEGQSTENSGTLPSEYAG